VACGPAACSTFAIGNTTVTCSTTDAAGNIGFASFTVTVTTASTQLTNLCARVQSVQVDPTTRKNLQSILRNAQAAGTKATPRRLRQADLVRQPGHGAVGQEDRHGDRGRPAHRCAASHGGAPLRLTASTGGTL
jgi:hypothetical protein